MSPSSDKTIEPKAAPNDPTAESEEEFDGVGAVEFGFGLAAFDTPCESAWFLFIGKLKHGFLETHTCCSINMTKSKKIAFL